MLSRQRIRIAHRNDAAGRSLPSDGELLPYVVRLSDPPTAHELLQLLACRILRQPIAIMPAKCVTTAEWLERYSPHKRRG
jgi:hypothetical protein